MTVLADEALDTAATPTLVAGQGASTLTFTYARAASTATSAIFDAVVPLGLPDGDYVSTITWSDVAGNRVSTRQGLPVVQVKTSPPSLAVNHDALVFVRSPWGNAAAEVLGPYTIPAGPYFAIEPADALTTTTAHLPAGRSRSRAAPCPPPSS